jgi:AcrR family transcriptional regulator
MAAGARKQVRGDKLVAKVFRATLAEVGRVGIEHLSIEEVAERACVNKTTIYRRWPTTERLAHAALVHAAETRSSPPDTGSLRGDLRAYVREFRRIAGQPDMKTVLRLRWSGGAHGPLATLMNGIQKKKQGQWLQVLRRAVERGELPPSSDVRLIHDVLVGTLIYLVILSPSRSDAARLDRAIDTILDGVLVGATGASRRG